MTKKRGLIILLICISIILILIGSFFYVVQSKGFDITIRNSTNSTISGLKITYINIKEDIQIPNIESEKIFKIKIKPTENFDENDMKIYYFDNKKNKQEETIIGYFEKGYSGKVTINIESIDANGKIKFKIESSYISIFF